MARGETLFRQWQLINVMQQYRFGVSTDELAERIECSRRTVQRDLAVLQDLFPIECEEREFGKRFWLLDRRLIESASLQLTMTEVLSLYLSRQLLLPLAGTQFGDGLHSALQKIRTILSEQALAYFEDLDNGFFVKHAARHNYENHDEIIRTLNDAIIHRRVLRVAYYSNRRGEEAKTDYHPYGMVLMEGALYCVGYHAGYGEVRTLKVLRIRRATVRKKTFSKPDSFSLDDHLRTAFGIIWSGEVQQVCMRFSDWAATVLRETRWHPSQTIVADEGDELVVEFRLHNSREFKRFVLSFGRHARVLSPEDLAREMREEHRQALQDR